MFAALLIALATATTSAPLSAQTHKVAKPENVVRAIGVYEWTGDMAKPAASRLIPVSIFIDDKLEDAAVYLARPVPLALLTGNVYQLQKSGVLMGDLDVAFARHLVAPETASTTYDDGWFGYGKFFIPQPPKKSTLKPVKTLASINAMDDYDDRPHFSSRSAQPGSGGAATPKAGTESSTDTPADDPDRPKLHRAPGSSDSSDSSDSSGQAAAGSGNNPAGDPDRPTLRRRSPEAASAASQPGAASVGNTLNDDPNRPLLHRGKPAGTAVAETDLPKLSGLPGDQDLHQLVAVSDPVDRPQHDFAMSGEDDNTHQAILAKMQAFARAQLTTYEAANAQPAATSKPAAAKPAVARPTTTRARRAAASAPPPPPEPLLEEELKGYMLSYGGAATYVYHAHTDGLGPTLRFVTIVAQINMQGEPEVALKNVTDAAHLDRTPRMRLVDAVDAEASKRASLLFELRAQNSRQFAIYRVIGAQATQTFITGSTQ
jgi:hypothetical protein